VLTRRIGKTPRTLVTRAHHSAKNAARLTRYCCYEIMFAGFDGIAAIYAPAFASAIGFAADRLDYLSGITISRSLVSTTKTASSSAGAVELAFWLTW
jgi:hypothetical protein